MRVAVVGAGPVGLSCARLLQRSGLDVTVLERDAVGASWRRHYDRLTLNTDRRLSSLPGRPIPAGCGQWVTRDEFVDYLESYAQGIPVECGVDVVRLDPRGSAWQLRTAGGRSLSADHVVLAAGPNRIPYLPSWPGSSCVPTIHSGDYGRPEPYAGKTVLVVGAGNSGSEIAADLAATSQVLLSVRTSPALYPRSIGPVPAQLAAFPLPLLPTRLGDLALSTTMRLWRRGDAARGLPTPSRPVSSARQGDIPVLDAGLRAAVEDGRVEVMAAVQRMAGDEVVLADGRHVRPDVVIAATGWRPDLRPLLGHLVPFGPDELPLRVPAGVHLVGFGVRLTGYLHAAGYDAVSVVNDINGASTLGAALTGLRRRLPLPA